MNVPPKPLHFRQKLAFAERRGKRFRTDSDTGTVILRDSAIPTVSQFAVNALIAAAFARIRAKSRNAETRFDPRMRCQLQMAFCIPHIRPILNLILAPKVSERVGASQRSRIASLAEAISAREQFRLFQGN